MSYHLAAEFDPEGVSRRVTLDKEITLSERELEVLSLISEELARKEIAQKLEISPMTVANHIAHIFEKLNVPNSPSAINKAHRMGILGSDD